MVGWAYVIFTSLLWFFGVHGSLALAALDSGIMTHGHWKTLHFISSTAPLMRRWQPVKPSMCGRSRCWTLISSGGTGATLGLIIAVFIVSRRADHRQVAKLALPSGIFQINEPILFGLPIIMNPVMFIPFVLIQPLLAGSL